MPGVVSPCCYQAVPRGCRETCTKPFDHRFWPPNILGTALLATTPITTHHWQHFTGLASLHGLTSSDKVRSSMLSLAARACCKLDSLQFPLGRDSWAFVSTTTNRFSKCPVTRLCFASLPPPPRPPPPPSRAGLAAVGSGADTIYFPPSSLGFGPSPQGTYVGAGVTALPPDVVGCRSNLKCPHVLVMRQVAKGTAVDHVATGGCQCRL